MELHGHRVIYRTAGSGAPVVLIHGMVNSSRHWEEVALRLATEYRVVAPDLIGHGDSATPRGDYSMGAHAAFIRDVLAVLGIERATIVGHSLGGGVAMQFFYQFPQYVERLVLISSGGLGSEVSPLLRSATLPGVPGLLALGSHRKVLAGVWQAGERLRASGNNTGVYMQAIVRALRPLERPGARGAFVHTLRSVIDVRGQRVSATDRLYLLHGIPTLIVWGERDRTIPLAHGRLDARGGAALELRHAAAGGALPAPRRPRRPRRRVARVHRFERAAGRPPSRDWAALDRAPCPADATGMSRPTMTVPPPEIFKAYDIRGLYGEQIDGDVAEPIGRAFARVLAELAGKPRNGAARGLGHDMRLAAPELSARYREGLHARGRRRARRGEVATEMLYFLVGSRELDGGLMCTASHNPKAYTGAKLVREGALALSGESGIQDIRESHRAALSTSAAERARRARRRGGGRHLRASSRKPRCGSSTRGGRRRPLKVVVDGGNGMAGPMVGPAARAARAGADRDLLDARRQLPRPRAQPAAAGEPPRDHRAGPRERRRPRHRVGRRRRPLLLHRRHGRVRRRRLPHRAPRGVAAREAPRRGDPLRRARLARRPGHRRAAPAGRPTSTASATRSSRRACARRARCSAARSPGTTTSATSTAPTPARCRRC